jgi:pectin methylesterase-like acyl-CoA thioesterase
MLSEFSKSFVLFSSLFALSNGAPSCNQGSRKQCQHPSDNVLDGCPQGTIVVGKDNAQAHFSSIQSAILSLPDDNIPRTILVLPGNYTEQLNITRAGPLTLLGQARHPNKQAENSVNVIYSNATGYPGVTFDNAFTSVLTVAPTLNASLTGSGPTGFPVPANTPFGNSDFRVYNIDFYNEFAPRSAGPALAVSVSYANAGFYNTGFYSYQDTVYIGKLGNAVFYGGEIAGQTDQLYGFGTAWIEKTQLTLRNCGGGIIAWKGTNTTFENKYGCYVSNSRIVAANSSIAEVIKGKCSLGRPWNSQQRSVYLNTYMDASILPAGYTPWGSTPATSRVDHYTFMAEYKSSGPGFNLTARLAGNLTEELNDKTVKPYKRPVDVFMTPEGKQPSIAWIDDEYVQN